MRKFFAILMIIAMVMLAASCRYTHPNGCVEVAGEKDGSTFVQTGYGFGAWYDSNNTYIGVSYEEDSRVYTTVYCMETMPKYPTTHY